MSRTNVINPENTLEMQEVIEKLKTKHSKLVECLLEHDHECYTRGGRLNKSATMRKLGLNSKQLEDALKELKELISDDFHLEFDED